MLTTILRRLLHVRIQDQRRRASRTCCRPFRPALEALEDRCLPSVALLSVNSSNSGTGSTTVPNTNADSYAYAPYSNEVHNDPYHNVSSNGQFVVFASTATDLTNNPGFDGRINVFWRDTVNHVTKLVSVTVHGNAGSAEGIQDQPVISADGRFVAFTAPALDQNDADQFDPNASFPNGKLSAVYVRDMVTGVTRVASCNGGIGGAGSASHPSISDPVTSSSESLNDVVVAFEYNKGDLGPTDTTGQTQVYVHYMNGNRNFLASRNATLTDGGNAWSYRPILSSDGSRVAFLSNATNLSSMPDRLGTQTSNLFSYQPVGNKLTLVDATPKGTYVTDFPLGPNPTYRVDASGLHFLFDSPSTQYVPGTNADELYFRDLTVAGGPTLVSTLLPGAWFDNHGYSISGDGQHVAFLGSGYANDAGGARQVYIWNTISHNYLLASPSINGGDSNNSSAYPEISDNGRYVAFVSQATDLVANFTNPSSTLFKYDTLARQTFPVAVDTSGNTGVDVDGGNPGLNPNAISRDGSTVVFTTTADASLFGFTDNNPGGNNAYVITMAPLSVPSFQVNLSVSTAITAGTKFSVTVTALDANGNKITNYNGTVHFSSSDPRAVLPADYTFTAADKGVHTFSNLKLVKAGPQNIEVTDTGNPPSLLGQATIVVNPAAASHLQINAPKQATAGTPFNITVFALDAFGNIATGYTGTVHFSSTDGGSGVVLPANYTFQQADAGWQVFTVTLKTVATQTITVSDTVHGTIAGKASVKVVAPPLTALVRRTGLRMPELLDTPFAL